MFRNCENPMVMEEVMRSRSLLSGLAAVFALLVGMRVAEAAPAPPTNVAAVAGSSSQINLT
jgi:hypothetical protein